VGSADKEQVVKNAGADLVINYTDKKGDLWVDEVNRFTNKKGADVVYDPVGGDIFDLSTKCIAWTGRLLVVGFTSNRIPSIAANRILLKNISVIGVFLGSHMQREFRAYQGYLQALNDMYTKVAAVDGLSSANKAHTAYRCLGEFRNTGKYGRVLVKYLHKVLHVYIDTQDGVGWKFCLAVQLEKTYKDYHIAFSAATGQVADNHDVLEVNTRYLAASDPDFDDSALPQMSDSESSSLASTLFWFLMIVAGAVLTVLALYETYQIAQIKQIDAVHVCERLNKFVLPHYALHWAVTILLAISMRWFALAVNLPLAVYRAVVFSRKQQTLNPSLVAQQNHSIRLYSAIAVYVVSELLFLHAFSQV